MTVRVEQKHIEFAQPGSHTCPIARSVRENLMKRRPTMNWSVMVIPGAVGISCWGDGPSKGCTYVLPPEANEFIARFDAGERVGPIEFYLDTTNREADLRGQV